MRITAELILTPTQLANQLGVSRSTIHRYKEWVTSRVLGAKEIEAIVMAIAANRLLGWSKKQYFTGRDGLSEHEQNQIRNWIRQRQWGNYLRPARDS